MNSNLSKNLFLALSMAFAPMAPALATPISVIPATSDKEASIQAKLDVDTVGMIKIPRGKVKLKGNKITVGAIPDWLFDRHTVLKGELIKSRIEKASSGKTVVRGLVYFDKGDWQKNLDNRRRRDNLVLDTGTILVGNVRAINEDTVDFQLATGQLKRVKKTSIAKLVSKRAFFFSIPTTNVKIDPATSVLSAQADLITFNPTVSRKKRRWFAKKKPVEPKTFLAGTEGGISKAQIAGLVMLDATNTIAPLVVLPIVASPLGSKSASRSLDEFQRLDEALIRSDVVVIP